MFCTEIFTELCPVSCSGCSPLPPSPPTSPPLQPAAEADVAPVSFDVTPDAAGHADFTFELIGGGVASVALLALLLLASRCVGAF